MDDYIKRETILDLTARKNDIWDKISDSSGRGLTEIIDSIPAADVVEVVRCRDCVALYRGEFGDLCCSNHGGLALVTEDSFCPYGRRKDDGRNADNSDQ